MYYKIVNKECDVYKKLHKLRTEELQMEEEYKQLLAEKIGLNWENFFGRRGQQNYYRVTRYMGFAFTEPEKVDPKIWKLHPEHEGLYIPNKKTKAGKEISELLSNGMKGHFFTDVYDCLGLEHPIGNFIFPFVEIRGEIIVVYLDEKIDLKDENIIEITKKEFYESYGLKEAK